MSERLYYEDAYTARFEAKISEYVYDNGRCAVVLDRSYFYPTSGGQPHDQGWINGIAVVDVTIRDEDGAVLHWLAGDGPSERDVTAEIDWPRRFDHMQHHTGQHILSQAFIRVAEAETVGFHLSDNSVTIDLDTTDLPTAQLEQAEALANEVVWQNRPVHIRTVTPAEARELPLRKVPRIDNDRLRLIDIEAFDLTACGGTHVAATGSVGMIKVLRVERRGNLLRVEFCCGQRALRDYRQKNEIVNQLTAELTTGATEIVVAVNRLQAQAREAQQAVKKLQMLLVGFEADELWQKGSRYGKITIVTHVFSDREPGQLRMLANRLSEKQATIALLGLTGSKTHLVFTRSADAPGDASQLLKEALERLGAGSGGGNASLAQGGGPAVEPEALQQALFQVKDALASQIQ